MAIIENEIIRGLLGPVIFKYRNGKQLITAKMAKGTMRQTKATIKAGGNFGMANVFASDIKRCLSMVLNNFQDADMFKRLCKTLYAAFLTTRLPGSNLFDFKADSFNALIGFDFNIRSSLKSYLKVTPVVTRTAGRVSVYIPELDQPKTLLYQSDAFICDIVASLSLFRLKDGLRAYESENQTIRLRRNKIGIDAHEFIFNVPDGCFCLISLSLYYFAVRKTHVELLNTNKFNPSMICDAFITAGIYEDIDNRDWTKMKSSILY